jgi:hypothetical protein
MAEEKKPIAPPRPASEAMRSRPPEPVGPKNPGVVTGAPIEGAAKDREADKNLSPLDEQARLADEAAREGKDALTQTTGGKLTDGNKTLAKSILGENVVEDKNAEAVKADLSSALANRGVRPAQPVEPGASIQREDGTLTVQGKEDHTVHYVHGVRVLITDEERDKVLALTEELNNLQDGRGISDIPTSDVYWEKKKELDAYVARLKR